MLRLFLRAIGVIPLLAAILQPIGVSANEFKGTLISIEAGAKDAQDQCFMKIHFDTFEYQHCITQLAERFPHDNSSNLGIYYFGYVGAMDSVRTGMYGAKNTAWIFLKKFRRLQNKLHIDDSLLCRTIPGDCEVRISQIKLMDKTREPKFIDLDGAVPGLHVH